ncbi:MAG: PAS domain-containing protein [Myxococcota bacterium]
MASPPGAHRLPERSLTLDEFAALTLDLLCVADLATATFTWVSRNWTTLLGWSLDELYDGPFIRFVHPDDIADTAGEVSHLQDGREVYRFLNRYRTKDGRYIWLEWNSIPFGDQHVFAIARDVTDAKRREREATQRNRLLELASDVGRIGYWRIDIENDALWWSKEVYRIHGLDPREGSPTLQQAFEAYHPDDRPKVERVVQRAIENQQDFDFELRLLRADGAVRQVMARGRVEPGPPGAAGSLFGTFQDVTEQRETASRLRRSERLVSLGTLAAGVAHEINNPLTYVVGNLTMLVEEIEDPELGQMARDAAHGAEHVRRVVDGLRTFSRMADGQQREVLPLDEVLDQAVQLSGHVVHHRAELLREGTGLPQVLGDRAPLVQVVCNLLINAAQAIPSNRPGHVRLRAFRDGADAVIDVEDDGPGIPEDVRERIFDPFFTTKGVGDGTGLGLSICMGTVESHGGTLRLLDARPGHTCFRVRLPVHEDQ